MKFAADIHGAQNMNYTDFGYFWTRVTIRFTFVFLAEINEI